MDSSKTTSAPPTETRGPILNESTKESESHANFFKRESSRKNANSCMFLASTSNGVDVAVSKDGVWFLYGQTCHVPGMRELFKDNID